MSQIHNHPSHNYTLYQASSGAEKTSPMAAGNAADMGAELVPAQDPDPSASGTAREMLKNSKGAPALPEPLFASLSSEDFLELLDLLHSFVFDAQKTNAESKIVRSRNSSRKLHEHMGEKIKTDLINSKKADEAARKSKIFGWLAKVFAVVIAVVAVVATVATAGAASPLLALAVIGLVGACISLADQIAKEVNPNNSVSLSTLFTKVVGGLLEKMGVDHTMAERIGVVVGGGIGFFTGAWLVEPQLFGEMSRGICELFGLSDTTKLIVTMTVSIVASVAAAIALGVAGSGATKAASSATGAASSLLKGFTSSASQVVQGGIQIGAGVFAIEMAELEAARGELAVEKSKIQAFLNDFQNQSSQAFEDYKKIVELMQNSLENIAQILNDIYENSKIVTKNFTHTRAAI